MGADSRDYEYYWGEVEGMGVKMPQKPNPFRPPRQPTSGPDYGMWLMVIVMLAGLAALGTIAYYDMTRDFGGGCECREAGDDR